MFALGGIELFNCASFSFLFSVEWRHQDLQLLPFVLEQRPHTSPRPPCRLLSERYSCLVKEIEIILL